MWIWYHPGIWQFGKLMIYFGLKIFVVMLHANILFMYAILFQSSNEHFHLFSLIWDYFAVIYFSMYLYFLFVNGCVRSLIKNFMFFKSILRCAVLYLLLHSKRYWNDPVIHWYHCFCIVILLLTVTGGGRPHRGIPVWELLHCTIHLATLNERPHA